MKHGEVFMCIEERLTGRPPVLSSMTVFLQLFLVTLFYFSVCRYHVKPAFGLTSQTIS